MAKYGELSPCELGRECLLEPTQNFDLQKKSGVIVDETKTLLKVRVDGEYYLDYWIFSKKNMLRTGENKVSYKLSFIH